jgi:hypothetical protein
VRGAKYTCGGLMVCAICVWAVSAIAETQYFRLDNVVLDDGEPMTGLFLWTYAPEEFADGTGEFVALDIPWTAHNHENLRATFDVGSSIEITLTNNVHDDGVDITLFVTNTLSATNSAVMDLVRSKYDIGGNGFHTGGFLSGTIVPTNLTLRVAGTSPGFVTLSWGPDAPGTVLQESVSLTPTNWTHSASGSTNPVTLPSPAVATFYRVLKP